MEVIKLPNSEVEITGEISAGDFTRFRAPALAALNERHTLPGFRPGRAPEEVLAKHLGEDKILLEMAELALVAHYPKIVETEKLDIIGRPEITLTKLAAGNPLGFKIKTAVTPEVKLPDYAKLAAAENRRVPDSGTKEEKEEPEELKKLKARDKKRLAIVEAVLAGSEIPLPPILVESELERMFAEIKADTERLGLKFDDYLKHLKKSEDELRTTWRGDAEKRVKIGLILAKIATEQKLTPSEEEIKPELEHLKKHYPNAEEARLRAYVAGQLTNEKCWQWLEEQK